MHQHTLLINAFFKYLRLVFLLKANYFYFARFPDRLLGVTHKGHRVSCWLCLLFYSRYHGLFLCTYYGDVF